MLGCLKRFAIKIRERFPEYSEAQYHYFYVTLGLLGSIIYLLVLWLPLPVAQDLYRPRNLIAYHSYVMWTNEYLKDYTGTELCNWYKDKAGYEDKSAAEAFEFYYNTGKNTSTVGLDLESGCDLYVNDSDVVRHVLITCGICVHFILGVLAQVYFEYSGEITSGESRKRDLRRYIYITFSLWLTSLGLLISIAVVAYTVEKKYSPFLATATYYFSSTCITVTALYCIPLFGAVDNVIGVINYIRIRDVDYDKKQSKERRKERKKLIT